LPSIAPKPTIEPNWLETIFLAQSVDALWARHRAAEAARETGMTDRGVWSVAIAAAELASNALKFAKGGRVHLYRLDEPRPGLRIVVEDDGPGIENIELALQDGFSEGRFIQQSDTRARVRLRGLGAGLGAVRRLMDTFALENRKEGGVRAVAEKFLSIAL